MPPHRIDEAVDRLVFDTVLPETPDRAARKARRLQARYHDQRANLFAFPDRPDVPPTNNASEQALRPAVIHRKVTGGYRSWSGADVSAVLTYSSPPHGNGATTSSMLSAPSPDLHLFTPPAAKLSRYEQLNRGPEEMTAGWVACCVITCE